MANRNATAPLTEMEVEERRSEQERKERDLRRQEQLRNVARKHNRHRNKLARQARRESR